MATTATEIAAAMKQAAGDAFMRMEKIESDRHALFDALQFALAALGEAVRWYGDEDTTFGATRRWREALDHGRAVIEHAREGE